MKLLDSEEIKQLKDAIFFDAVSDCQSDLASVLIALANEIVAKQNSLGSTFPIMDCHRRKAKELMQLLCELMVDDLPVDVRDVVQGQDRYDDLPNDVQERLISETEYALKAII